VKFETRNLKSEEAVTRCARLISPGDAIRNSIHSNFELAGLASLRSLQRISNLRRQSRRLLSHA